MRLIADHLWFPEGPVALGDGSFLVVEIRRKTLTRIFADGRTKVVAELGGGPNGAAIGPDGHCYVVNNGGFKWAQRSDGAWVNAGIAEDYAGGCVQRVEIETGRFDVLYNKVGDEPLRGPNDIVFDAHGGFYFTDPGKVRPRAQDRGKVCYAKADGSEIRELIFPIHKPNGIALSPDGGTLYVAETESARVWAWELAASGKLAKSTAASHTSPHGGRLIYGSATYQRFDGLAVEENGNICVATIDVGGISVCSASGSLVEFVPVQGDRHSTNLCFGGPGLKKAYVTQSYAGHLVELDWPRPGMKLFA